MSMKSVIVITGASSGFGALAARALAKAGHTVYASMRDSTGHNAAQVDEAKRFSSENNVDLRTIELDVLSEESVNTAVRQKHSHRNSWPNSTTSMSGAHSASIVRLSHNCANKSRDWSSGFQAAARQ